MMPKALDGQIVMEKTPRYFVTVETPARVHAMSHDVKLIVVVRDPVTRAISDYTQIISKTPDIPPFESLAFKNRTTGTDPAVRVQVFKHILRMTPEMFSHALVLVSLVPIKMTMNTLKNNDLIYF